MPNWIRTQINISGPKDKLKEFEAGVFDFDDRGEDLFSFDKILPKPKELENTVSPDPKGSPIKLKGQDGTIVECVQYPENLNDGEIASALQRGEIPPDPIPCNNATPNQQAALRKKFGVSNWYDWTTSTWGTKWGASDTCYTEGEGENFLTFQTAWSFPEPIYLAMVEKFPDLHFSGSWADEDFGSNVGIFEEDGVMRLEDHTEDSYTTAGEVWGIEGHYDGDAGEWVEED